MALFCAPFRRKIDRSHVALTAVERARFLDRLFQFSILDAEITRSTSTTTGLARIPGSPKTPGPGEYRKKQL